MSCDPYIWIAAILTLCVFSFLYKDNPFFCVAEHLVVGLSTGYLFCTYWNNVFMPELITPLVADGFGAQAHLWVVVFICLLWACKYVESLKDLSKIALAFWLSVDLGLAIPTEIEAGVLAQVFGTIDLNLNGTLWDTIGSFVLFFGTIAALSYFYFSKTHTGPLGISAQMGTWVLMIGFGASFSYIILSRIYLLIGRLVFLLRDWLGII